MRRLEREQKLAAEGAGRGAGECAARTVVQSLFMCERRAAERQTLRCFKCRSSGGDVSC